MMLFRRSMPVMGKMVSPSRFVMSSRRAYTVGKCFLPFLCLAEALELVASA
jgi:hypothetical protein